MESVKQTSTKDHKQVKQTGQFQLVTEYGAFSEPLRADDLDHVRKILKTRRSKDPNGIYYIKDVSTNTILGE